MFIFIFIAIDDFFSSIQRSCGECDGSLRLGYFFQEQTTEDTNANS
jgi:hypothetical protein